jgi:4-hydroxybenzoate polyprenyltransferase
MTALTDRADSRIQFTVLGDVCLAVAFGVLAYREQQALHGNDIPVAALLFAFTSLVLLFRAISFATSKTRREQP